jgi:WhiB family transcriptional regulator, redox-sensing transcriptional regulator
VKYWSSPDALCRGMDLATFFSLGNRDEVAHARQVCKLCPVMEACLEAALDEEHGTEGFGIRGGHTPKERKKLARKRTRTAKIAAEKASKTTAA